MNIPHSIEKYTKPHKKRLGRFIRKSFSDIYLDLCRHVLRHVFQPTPPRPLAVPIPVSTVDVDDTENTVTVLVADGTNKNSQKNSTIPTLMPTLPVVRELISYVPTMKNVATRGHLIGIPYLGDKFDAEDQRLINSISIEPSKQQKLIRSKLDILFLIQIIIII
jgi:hypothetical protein